MKKLFRSTLAVAGAFAMAVTSVAAVPTVAKADFNSAYAVFNPSVLHDGEVHYTIAGGMTGWNTLAEANAMQETDIDGVYSMKLTLGAYDKAAEWNNRFKICQVDNTVLADNAWDHSILLGTGLYGDSETQFRIENAEAGEFTVYFKPSSGAVVIKDANGTTVDYTISWAGNEKDAPIVKNNNEEFVKVSEAGSTKLEDWETNKIPASVTAVPDFTKINAALDSEITTIDPSTMKAGEVEYTIAGGMTGWATLGKANTMKKTDIDGVYSMKVSVGAYDKAAEWNNRFKICQVDNTVLADNAWDHSILLGTTLYGDSETQFRIENAEAGEFTVYFKPSTGAVVIKDATGADIDYTISWAGNEKDAPIIKNNNEEFVKVSEAGKTTLADWEENKIPAGVTAVPDFAKINAALSTEVTNLDPTVMKAGEVAYTIAGGMTGWNTLGRANVMAKTDVDGVYSMKISLGAYDKAAEWNNRFKICQVDNTVLADNAWDHSILLGTTLYGDSETQFRVENAEAGEFTVYFKPSTGAVVIKDAAGTDVDYTISWAGNEKDAPIIKNNDGEFVKVSEAGKTALTDWEENKIPAGVTAVPDFAKLNAALSTEITTLDPTTMKAGEAVYTIAGGMTGWATLGRANVMSATRYPGVYAMKLTVGAYDKAAEWNNRFKICKVDNTVLADNAWDHSILLGTTLYGDSETQFRIENAEAGEYTVFYDANTGAVVIKDAAGADVDYTISWAGNEKDAPIIKNNNEEFVKVSEAGKTTLADWEENKIPAGVTAVPDFATINAALSAKLATVPETVEEEPQVKASLSLKVSTRTLYTGKASNATTIKASVVGESKKVTWKSSNTKVATVSNGKVTAKKAGKAKITATANGITKTVTITVKNPTITVKLGSKKITSISVKAKSTTKLAVTTSPSKAGYKATYANSSSKKLIKISTSGSKVTVKALKKGTAKIKITSGGSTRTITIKVK